MVNLITRIAVAVAISLIPLNGLAKLPPLKNHVVREGETLSSIARKYCTEPLELYLINKGKVREKDYRIREGEILEVIPRCDYKK